MPINVVCMNVSQIIISSEEPYSVFIFFRHETLRQGLISTISDVISTPTKYTCVYYYKIRILKDLSIKLYINGIFINVSQLQRIIGHIFVSHVSSMGRALAFRADGPGSIPGPA